VRSWRDNLIDIKPYAAGEQRSASGLIKLNTNENPFPPSPAVHAAAKAFDADALALYPDPDARALTGVFAEKEGVDEDRVIAGNGSDEILAFAFRAFFNSGRPVLFPDITYSFYPVWCDLFGIPYEVVPLRGDFHADADDYARGGDVGVGGVVLANPNAPTGIAEGEEFFRKVLASNQGCVVIVDEAYVDFGARSLLPLTKEYDNLFVVRTLSKSRSLAGLRLGFGFGAPELISAVKTVKNSFNSYTVDSFALAVGVAAAGDEPYYAERTERLLSVREEFTASLRRLGFIVADSSANFVFATHPGLAAEDLYRWLDGRDILVRWFAGPRIGNHLRITIGRKEEMDALLAAIRAYMREERRQDAFL
jgi:histidinol-phosphate aminotransferase